MECPQGGVNQRIRPVGQSNLLYNGLPVANKTSPPAQPLSRRTIRDLRRGRNVRGHVLLQRTRLRTVSRLNSGRDSEKIDGINIDIQAGATPRRASPADHGPQQSL